MIHGNDGYDRTLQVSSLSQIICDSYYRKIIGFLVLIEKEWIKFGHPFLKRGGIIKDQFKEDELSPIFIQFLDCVKQLINQFPNSFEYNTEFLNYFAYHIYSGKYKPFFYNSEKERMDDNSNYSITLWVNILKIYKDKFVNPYFYINKMKFQNFIKPNYSLYKINLWYEYYFKFSSNFKNDSNQFTSKNYFEFEKLLSTKFIKSKKDEVMSLKYALEDIKQIANLLNINHNNKICFSNNHFNIDNDISKKSNIFKNISEMCKTETKITLNAIFKLNKLTK